MGIQDQERWDSQGKISSILGDSQIPGVNYTHNFAPVAYDVSFRIALAMMMVEKLDILVMDVETAFLYGEIDEEIFMKSPVGMKEIWIIYLKLLMHLKRWEKRVDS